MLSCALTMNLPCSVIFATSSNMCVMFECCVFISNGVFQIHCAFRFYKWQHLVFICISSPTERVNSILKQITGDQRHLRAYTTMDDELVVRLPSPPLLEAFQLIYASHALIFKSETGLSPMPSAACPSGLCIRG